MSSLVHKKRMLKHLESTMKHPKIVLGIATMPCLHANFMLPDKSNPLEDAILRMCKEVLDETMAKLMAASAKMCAVAGVEFDEMTHEDITSALKHYITRETHDAATLMSEDGTVTIGEAIDVKLSGKRTDH